MALALELSGEEKLCKFKGCATDADGNPVYKIKKQLLNIFRLRINGFNAARISTVQGLTQAGVQIVAIEDVTVVNWHWPQRARIAPSKN